MNKFSSPISFKNFQVEAPKFLELDATQDFMGEILDELNEGVQASDRGDESYIRFDGEIEKLKGKYEEFLQIVGTIKTTFYTHDIMSNEVMTDSLEQEVKCLVLTDEVSKKLHMEDEIDIEHNGEEYDLYFLDADENLDFKGILHEYIYLNKNPYPKVSTDSPEEG